MSATRIPVTFADWQPEDIACLIDLLIEAYLDGNDFAEAGGVGVVAGLRIAKAYLPGDECPVADAAALAQMHVLANYSLASYWYDAPDENDFTSAEMRRHRQLKVALKEVERFGQPFRYPPDTINWDDFNHFASLDHGDA